MYCSGGGHKVQLESIFEVPGGAGRSRRRPGGVPEGVRGHRATFGPPGAVPGHLWKMACRHKSSFCRDGTLVFKKSTFLRKRKRQKNDMWIWLSRSSAFGVFTKNGHLGNGRLLELLDGHGEPRRQFWRSCGGLGRKSCQNENVCSVEAKRPV